MRSKDIENLMQNIIDHDKDSRSYYQWDQNPLQSLKQGRQISKQGVR